MSDKSKKDNNRGKRYVLEISYIAVGETWFFKEKNYEKKSKGYWMEQKNYVC